MRIVRAENLKPGMIVADTSRLCKITTVMEFVGFEDRAIGFKYLYGKDCYYENDNGLIYFDAMGHLWNNISKEELKQWMKDYRIGTGNAVEG